MLHIRAHGTGGWSAVYTGKILFAAEGAYTLDSGLPIDVERNFASLDELFTYIDALKVASDVTVNVVNAGTFAMDLRGEDARSLVDRIGSYFADAGKTLEFKAEASALLDFQVNPEDVVWALELSNFMITDNVIIRVNGEAFDFGLLKYRNDEVCPGGLTEYREWGAMSALVDVEWSLQSAGNGKISGALESGTGDLPVMTLDNTSLCTDSLCYNVRFMYDGVEFRTFGYCIMVRPSSSEVISRLVITRKDARISSFS